MFTNMLELFCMARGVCPLLCVRGCWYSLEKVLWEQSGKVDSHKQANLRHLLREALESLVTVLQFCTAHHKLCVSSFFYYYSPASGRICCVYYGWVLGLSKGRGTTQFKMGLSVPIRPLCVFVKNNATEGAFQRKRHIQLADIQCAKEVKLLRLAQPIVLITVWSWFSLLPAITFHMLYSACHSRQTSNLGECFFCSAQVYIGVGVCECQSLSACVRVRGQVCMCMCSARGLCCCLFVLFSFYKPGLWSSRQHASKFLCCSCSMQIYIGVSLSDDEISIRICSNARKPRCSFCD